MLVTPSLFGLLLALLFAPSLVWALGSLRGVEEQQVLNAEDGYAAVPVVEVSFADSSAPAAAEAAVSSVNAIAGVDSSALVAEVQQSAGDFDAGRFLSIESEAAALVAADPITLTAIAATIKLANVVITQVNANTNGKLVAEQGKTNGELATLNAWTAQFLTETGDTLAWALQDPDTRLNEITEEIGMLFVKRLSAQGLVAIAERAVTEAKAKGSGSTTQAKAPKELAKLEMLVQQAKTTLSSATSAAPAAAQTHWVTVIGSSPSTSSPSGAGTEDSPAVAALRSELITILLQDYSKALRALSTSSSSASPSTTTVGAANPFARQGERLSRVALPPSSSSSTGSNTKASGAGSGEGGKANKKATLRILKGLLPGLDRFHGAASSKKGSKSNGKPDGVISQGSAKASQGAGDAAALSSGSAVATGNEVISSGSSLHNELDGQTGGLATLLQEGMPIMDVAGPGISLAYGIKDAVAKWSALSKAPLEAAKSLGIAAEHAQTLAVLSRFSTCRAVHSLKSQLRTALAQIKQQAEDVDALIQRHALEEARAVAVSSSSSSSSPSSASASSPPYDASLAAEIDVALTTLIGDIPEITAGAQHMMGHRDKLDLYRQALFKLCSSFASPLYRRLYALFKNEDGFCRAVGKEFPALPRAHNGPASTTQPFTERKDGRLEFSAPIAILADAKAFGTKKGSAASSSSPSPSKLEGHKTTKTRCKAGHIVDLQITSSDDLGAWLEKGYVLVGEPATTTTTTTTGTTSTTTSATAASTTVAVDFKGDLSVPLTDLPANAAPAGGKVVRSSTPAPGSRRQLLALECSAAVRQITKLSLVAKAPSATTSTTASAGGSPVAPPKSAEQQRAVLDSLSNGSQNKKSSPSSSSSSGSSTLLTGLSEAELSYFWLLHFLQVATRQAPISGLRIASDAATTSTSTTSTTAVSAQQLRAPSEGTPLYLRGPPSDLLLETVEISRVGGIRSREQHNALADIGWSSPKASAKGAGSPTLLYVSRGDHLPISGLEILPFEPVVKAGVVKAAPGGTGPVAPPSSSFAWAQGSETSLLVNEKKAKDSWASSNKDMKRSVNAAVARTVKPAPADDALGKAVATLHSASQEGVTFPTTLAAPKGCSVVDRIYRRERLVSANTREDYAVHSFELTCALSDKAQQGYSLPADKRDPETRRLVAEEIQTVWERVPVSLFANPEADGALAALSPYLWVKRVLELDGGSDTKNKDGKEDKEDVTTCSSPAPANYLFVHPQQAQQQASAGPGSQAPDAAAGGRRGAVRRAPTAGDATKQQQPPPQQQATAKTEGGAKDKEGRGVMALLFGAKKK